VTPEPLRPTPATQHNKSRHDTAQQENLEKFTEHLSWLAEQPLEEFKQEAKRSEAVNYTRVTETFLKNLLKSVEDGLGDDDDEEAVALAMAAGGGGGGAGGAGGGGAGMNLAASAASAGGGAASSAQA
jgi:mevalonate kinase